MSFAVSRSARLALVYLHCLVGVSAASCARESDSRDGLRLVQVSGVHHDDQTESAVLRLEEIDGEQRGLGISIGAFEAESIERAIERPNPHDLMKTVLERMDGRLARILVTELRDGTYYAIIELESHSGRVEVDARPSDAIALAVRTETPIYVRESLFGPEQILLPADEHTLDIDWRTCESREAPYL